MIENKKGHLTLIKELIHNNPSPAPPRADSSISPLIISHSCTNESKCFFIIQAGTSGRSIHIFTGVYIVPSNLKDFPCPVWKSFQKYIRQLKYFWLPIFLICFTHNYVLLPLYLIYLNYLPFPLSFFLFCPQAWKASSGWKKGTLYTPVYSINHTKKQFFLGSGNAQNGLLPMETWKCRS